MMKDVDEISAACQDELVDRLAAELEFTPIASGSTFQDGVLVYDHGHQRSRTVILVVTGADGLPSVGFAEALRAAHLSIEHAIDVALNGLSDIEVGKLPYTGMND
jgi:hypothetical protein